MRGGAIKKEQKVPTDELHSEYDFDYSKAVHGKFYRRLLAKGANVLVLDADIEEAFHDSAAVNLALRSPLDLTRSTQRLTQAASVSCRSLLSPTVGRQIALPLSCCPASAHVFKGSRREEGRQACR